MAGSAANSENPIESRREFSSPPHRSKGTLPANGVSYSISNQEKNMSTIPRRTFLENTILGVLAATPAGRILAAEEPTSGAGEKITLGVIGTGSRGMGHLREFAARKNCEIAYVCDPDEGRAARAAKLVERNQSRAPKAVRDMREIFDDDAVDAVSIATCNHWHALGAILAMQAGKDVYVEKPVSHNVSEGRRIVETARKYKRICQAGTQNRSVGHMASAARYIQEGRLGEVKLARVIIHRRRGPIGPPGNYPVPEGVDYNLWAGPAPMAPVTRKNFHYDWHWFWDFGNGEIGNNGIHYVDVCRWMLDLKGPGKHVLSYGGRFGPPDAGETADTQIAIHDFDHATVVQEVRNLETTPYPIRGGAVIFGSEGCIGLSRAASVLFDLEGKVVRGFKGP